eukprot:UC4_evm1s1135
MASRCVAHISKAEFSKAIGSLGLHYGIRNNFESSTKVPLKIVVAVSGGPDSMALCFLLRRYLWSDGDSNLKHDRHPRIHAVTVDHGLRRESAEEAKMVGRWFRDLMPNVSHSIVPADWSDSGSNIYKSRSSIQERARIARYNALISQCISVGAQWMLVGHHFDDQIETFIMRLERNSGLDGLAGMLEEVSLAHIGFAQRLISKGYLHDVRLARPLLQFDKKRILATCTKHGLPWINDPTNVDVKHRRCAVRSVLDRSFQNNIQFKSYIRTVLSSLKHLRLDVAAKVNDLVEKYAFVDTQFGTCEVNLKILDIPHELRMPFFSSILKRIGAKQYNVARKDVEAAISYAQNFDNTDKSFNAGGCVLTLCLNRKDDKYLLVRRQPRNQNHNERKPITFGTTYIWDRRFLVSIWENESEKKEKDFDKPMFIRCQIQSDLNKRLGSNKITRWENARELAMPVV